jgi:hypothetical protein
MRIALHFNPFCRHGLCIELSLALPLYFYAYCVPRFISGSLVLSARLGLTFGSWCAQGECDIRFILILISPVAASATLAIASAFLKLRFKLQAFVSSVSFCQPATAMERVHWGAKRTQAILFTSALG